MQEEGCAVSEALTGTVLLLPFLGVLGQETKNYYPNRNRSQVEPTSLAFEASGISTAQLMLCYASMVSRIWWSVGQE